MLTEKGIFYLKQLGKPSIYKISKDYLRIQLSGL